MFEKLLCMLYIARNILEEWSPFVITIILKYPFFIFYLFLEGLSHDVIF